MTKIRFFLLFFIFISDAVYAVDIDIFSIYINSRGNNEYEAKIISIDSGIKRAFILATDKMLIKDPKLNSIPLDKIKSTISDINIYGEEIERYAIGVRYFAQLNISFDQVKFNSLILEHGSEITHEKFYEAGFIPIFKINNLYYINPSTTDFWVPFWYKNRINLNENMIFLPEMEDAIEQKIRNFGYDSITFEEYLSIVNFRLVKSLIIPIAEFYTNRNDGSTYMRVDFIKKLPDNTTEKVTKKFKVNQSESPIKSIYELCIDHVISNYGREKNEFSEISHKEHEAYNINKIMNPTTSLVDSEKSFNFRVEIYDPKEIDSILEKLRNIKEFKNFTMRNIDSVNYSIKIYTDKSLSEVAELFYYNKLSYYQSSSGLVLLELH